MDTQNKPLWRMVIEKFFCHHKYATIEQISIKNRFGETTETTILRECIICGNSKINRL